MVVSMAEFPHLDACPNILQATFPSPVVQGDGRQSAQCPRAQAPCHVCSCSYPEASVQRCQLLVTTRDARQPQFEVGIRIWVLCTSCRSVAQSLSLLHVQGQQHQRGPTLNGVNRIRWCTPTSPPVNNPIVVSSSAIHSGVTRSVSKLLIPCDMPCKAKSDCLRSSQVHGVTQNHKEIKMRQESTPCSLDSERLRAGRGL